MGVSKVIPFLAIIYLFIAFSYAQVTLEASLWDQAPSSMANNQHPNNANEKGSCGTANNGNGFSGIDFERVNTEDRGIVGAECRRANWNSCGLIDQRELVPMYAHGNGESPKKTVRNKASFDTWFKPSNFTKKVDIFIPVAKKQGTLLYEYQNSSFFPLDGLGWKDYGFSSDGKKHNFAYCMDIHSIFAYNGGETFEFQGDDDVFVYLDGHLVIDLGGVHGAQTKSVFLGDLPLSEGTYYRFDFFYCERHTRASTFKITTSMELKCSYHDWCGRCAGTGQTCCNATSLAVCDDNNACTIESCPVLYAPNATNCVREFIDCETRVHPNKCMEYYCQGGNVRECGERKKTCIDPSGCKIGRCDPAIGCQYDNKCDDKITCTEDKCTAGVCSFTELNCDKGNKCMTYSCKNSTTNGCQESKANCDDYDECTLNGCNEKTGCVYTNITCPKDTCHTATCDKKNGCGLMPISCDDGKICTFDSCDATKGCIHTEIPNCEVCKGADLCVPCDGLPCNYTDPCKPYVCNSAKKCVPDTAPVCPDDNNACTETRCEAKNNRALCSYPFNCPDSKDPCNPIVCRDKKCVATNITCDDENMCTDDKCQRSSDNTTYTCIQTQKCEGDACGLSCDPKSGQCVPPVCDDGNYCTDDSYLCANGTAGCQFAYDFKCNDSNVCTFDKCGSTNCSHEEIPCPEKNACFVKAGCDPVDGCKYVPVNCEVPGDLCKVAVCDEISGCIVSDKICPAGDINCFVGKCDPATGACSREKVSDYKSSTSSNGVMCPLRYDTAVKAAAIGAGAAVGIAIGAAAFVGLAGFGSKKGWDMYQAHFNTKDAAVSQNPLYNAPEGNADSPIYEPNE